MAQGGAYTASPDFLAAFWNPAVPSLLRDRRVAGGFGFHSLGRTEAFAAFDFRVPPRVGVGLFALYRGDPFLNDLYDPEENPLPKTSYTTITIKSALSYHLTRKVAAGIAVNALYQNLPVYGDEGGVKAATVTNIGSLDAAVAYRLSNTLTVAAVIRYIGANMQWQMGDMAPIVEDRPLPGLTLGCTYTTTLAEKPLVCALDLKAFLFDGEWNQVDRAEVALCAGGEWRRWDNFYVRAGIADLPFTGDMINDRTSYRDGFGMQVTAGFAYRPLKARKNMWMNYAVATDKVWAGINQQLDVSLVF